jgi:hypothetical protein
MFSVWSVRRLCKSSNNIETTEQSSNNWEVSHFSTSQNEDSFQSEFELVNSVRSELVTRQEGREQEYKESSCEELTQCITARQSVVINCEGFKCDY